MLDFSKIRLTKGQFDNMTTPIDFSKIKHHWLFQSFKFIKVKGQFRYRGRFWEKFPHGHARVMITNKPGSYGHAEEIDDETNVATFKEHVKNLDDLYRELQEEERIGLEAERNEILNEINYMNS